jgi:hypothetical protein
MICLPIINHQSEIINLKGSPACSVGALPVAGAGSLELARAAERTNQPFALPAFQIADFRLMIDD